MKAIAARNTSQSVASSRAGRPFKHLILRRAVPATCGLSIACPAMAIPSPDLVVNVFANAAQVVGLITVLLGSFAVSKRRRAARASTKSTHAQASRSWLMPALNILLCLSVGGIVLQWAYQQQQDANRLNRNLVRTSVENGQAVGDTSLKTLSFSDQNQHPLGMSTDDLSAWIQQAQPINLVDVRETEETEAGMIAGAWHARYPELLNNPSLLNQANLQPQKQTQSRTRTRTLLVCYSGNRSSELVNGLSSLGHDVSFLIGGYEKWLSENRPLVTADGRPTSNRNELRSLPKYSNNTVLLDTPEVEALIAKDQAVIIDVRYPQDFAQDAIPGAINIPLRKMLDDEISTALGNLPTDKAFVVACYDKRSSFYGQILGLKLERSGRRFAGRYTVPHEYMLVKKQRDHVAQWQASQQASVFSSITQPLGAFIAWCRGLTGSLSWAILLSVVLIRLAFIRWSLANDRDQAIERRLADEVQAIKATANRTDRTTKMMAWQKAHGIRPLRNLIATVFQLALFSAFFAAVSKQAKMNPEGFGPWDALQLPDPSGALSIGMALLMAAHLKIGSIKTGKRAWAMPVAGALFLGAITYPLSTAVNLYLISNVLFMFIQQRLVSHFIFKQQDQRLGAPLPSAGVCGLDLAHRVPGTGNKAIRLGQMLAHNLPVPHGFVVTERAFADGHHHHLELTETTRSQILKAWRRLGARKVAVRSSGSKEDGEDKSYAGVFESVLNVAWPHLEEALAEVHASLRSTRAAAYTGSDTFDAGAAVVQAMVPELTHAGVLFTEHPTDTGAMLVEYVDGIGEALVSGQATPHSMRLGRLSGQLLDAHENKPPLPFSELALLGRQIEQLFGKPQDIEWGYGQGRFWILQARDITVDGIAQLEDKAEAAFQEDRRQALNAISAAKPSSALAEASSPALAMNELTELLPKPTPMSLSLMQRLWDHDGATDLACQQLGVPYTADENAPPMVMTLAGQLVINQPESTRRHTKAPSALTSYRISRDADAIADHYTQQVLPDLLKRVRLDEALDFGRFEAHELIDLFDAWSDRFVCETYVHAEEINIIADLSVKAATRMLEKHGLEPARELATQESTIVAQAMHQLPLIARGEAEPESFSKLFGHRAPHDYELAAPRYSESPRLVMQLIDRCKDTGSEDNPRSSAAQPTAMANTGKVLKSAVQRAQRFQVMKENAKHHSLREWAQLRRLLLAIDQCLGLDGGVFYLRPEELTAFNQHQERRSLSRLIAQRLSAHEAMAGCSIPAAMSLIELEKLSLHPEQAPSLPAEGALVGMAVSGVGATRGPVRVVMQPEQIDKVKPGEILVTRFTDPLWTPLFSKVGGVITEVGGRLSHAAIVAREYGMPAIVGVPHATQHLKTGDLIELKPDGSVNRIDDQRRGPRESLEVVVTLKKDEASYNAILKNLNGRGALIQTSEKLRVGDAVELDQPHDKAPQTVRVLRKQDKNSYAVELVK